MTVRVLFFAYLRERCGNREIVVRLPDGASVADLWGALCRRYESLAVEQLRFAVNQTYVDRSHPLQDNDEIALIPPVSGGAGEGRTVLYNITEDRIDTNALLAAVGDRSAGGTVLFVGTTRDVNEGRAVERLEYEAYREMAVSEMACIGAEIERRWPVAAVAMVHRVGIVPIGEASVAVAVSAPHRDAAFEACSYGIDRLKTAVPIWKKEYYREGAVWIGACREHAATTRGGSGT
jgi:molybdopterin synthase catalytic subunit